MVTTNEYTPSNELTEDMVYYWKVTATDDDGGTKSSGTRSFWTNSENSTPEEFTLLDPLDNSVLENLNPQFCWESSTDQDLYDVLNYKIHLGENVNDISVIYEGPHLDYCFDETSNLVVDNTTYYWKVIAEDLSGATTENTGGFHSFRVNTANDPPGEFDLLAPEHNSMITELTPTFHWEVPLDPDDRSRSIVSYDVYIGEDDTFTGVNPDMVTTNEYTPSNELTEDMVYYWKVTATDDDGGTKSSGTRSFWTNSENSTPEEFILLTRKFKSSILLGIAK